MSRLRMKKMVLSALREPHLTNIESKLKDIPPKSLLNPLFIALCNPHEIVRWNAVRYFGIVVPAIASNNLEDARIVMRRFLWMLNDESGGIGWGVPEALGEVMSQQQELFDEYSHMLISYMRKDGEELFQDGNFIELPMLQRGLLWGIGRLCTTYREKMKELNINGALSNYLNSSDKIVVGMALLCLVKLGCNLGGRLSDSLCTENFSFTVYNNGLFENFTTLDLAECLRS